MKYLLLFFFFSVVFSQLPFSVSTSQTLSPLEAKVKLTPNLALRIAGIKDISLGVKIPNCGRAAQFYLDLTSWDSPINKVFTTNFSIVVPRVCASDFGVSIPFTQACFRIDDLTIYKSVVFGKIKSDLSVGVTGLQYNIANITLYDFKIGNQSSTTCFQQKNLKDCISSSGCGWCSTNNFCLDMNSDKLTDICNFCPRCSLFTTENIKEECLKRDSCGWCNSYSTCLPGDRFGPLDPSIVCSSSSLTNDVLQSTNEWLFTTKDSNSNNSLVGLTVFLSFFFSITGIIIGLIIGIISTIIGYNLYKKK